MPELSSVKWLNQSYFSNRNWFFFAVVDVSKVAFVRSYGVNVTGGSDVFDIQQWFAMRQLTTVLSLIHVNVFL